MQINNKEFKKYIKNNSSPFIKKIGKMDGMKIIIFIKSLQKLKI